MIHITLPGIATCVVLLGVLGLGNVLNAGFDQVYNLYNPLVYSTGDIIDTWVYRLGLQNLQFSLATAAGLFKSVISFVLIVISYILANKFADYTVF
jgi:putative aldouronate transport system permease protein